MAWRIIIIVFPFVALTAIFRGSFVWGRRLLASSIAISATVSGKTGTSSSLHLNLLSSNRLLGLLLHRLRRFLFSAVLHNFAFLKVNIYELGEATLDICGGGKLFLCFATSVLGVIELG